MSVSPVSLKETIYELSSCSASVNAPDFELPASYTPANAVIVGLSVSSVSVNEPDYELFVFPALALGAKNALFV